MANESPLCSEDFWQSSAFAGRDITAWDSLVVVANDPFTAPDVSSWVLPTNPSDTSHWELVMPGAPYDKADTIAAAVVGLICPPGSTEEGLFHIGDLPAVLGGRIVKSMPLLHSECGDETDVVFVRTR